jgi:hypothetical protein
MATGAPLINNLLPSRVRATSAHTSCSIIASARSMPVVIPAEVHTGPSMMRIRSSSTSLLGTEPASHLRGASARSRDGHGADLLQPARTRRRTVEATGRDSLQSLAQKFDQTRVNDAIAALPPTISVSKFGLSNGSVATPAPIELLVEPPVLDSRRT